MGKTTLQALSLRGSEESGQQPLEIAPSAAEGTLLYIAPGNAADVGIKIKAIASQSGDLLQVANSSDTTLSGITENGVVFTKDGGVSQPMKSGDTDGGISVYATGGTAYLAFKVDGTAYQLNSGITGAGTVALAT